MKVGKIVLLILAVLLGSNAGLAAVEIDGLTYIVDESDRSATLIKCGLEGEIHIPNCININDEAYEVKCIGEGFENASPLFVNATSVFIPSSVLQIRRRVFSRCSKLQSITFEDGDQPLYISGKEDDSGTGAFYLCTSLKYIYLGRSFSKVNLFYQTNIGGPIKLEISPNLKNIRGFSGAPLDPDVDLSNIEVIGDDAFSSTSLSDIKLPNIKRIGVAAFFGCNLLNVQFGSMLEKIGDLAFYGTKIQTLTLPKSLQEVGIRAFDEIKSLKSITIEDSDEPLYIRPYEGVEMFKEARIEELHVGRNIDLYSSNEYCGPFGINVSKINNYPPMELTFGKNVTRINHSMFANRAIKGDLLLPDSIEIIMDYGFVHGTVRNGNNKIKCLKLPRNLKSCGLMPFGMQYAEKVIVPEGITFLSSQLFPFPVGKKGRIEIPSSVEVIETQSNFIGDTIMIADRQTPLNIKNVDFEGEYIYCGMPLESSYGWDDNVIKCQTFEVGKESKRCEIELNLSGENPMIISHPLKPPYINNIDNATYKNAKVVIEFDSFKDYKESQIWSKFENYDFFITLSNRNLSLKLDESIEIQGSINLLYSNDNVLTWTSSNEEVAIINDGVVYAKTIGTCNIIAKDRLGHIATCQITVNPVQVESISLNPKEWGGVITESFQIISTIFPDNANNKTLEWSSSDENVAVVDESGTVTAVGVGKCVITAAATDGSGVTATCEITVNPVLVESMTLTPAEWNGIEGETFQITAVVLPENATDKSLEWSSSNELVATVDNSGLVSVLKEGSCVITAKTTDGSEISAECIVTSTSGIDDIFADADERFDIYNMQGVLIKKDCNRDSLKMLSSGIYILRQGRETRKLIIR